MTNAESLIRQAEKYLTDRVVLSDPRFVLPLVLWAAHTHVWQLCEFNAVPYLNFAGSRASGKNHTMDMVGSLSYNYVSVGKTTEAALRDIVHETRPTLGLSECERELASHNSYMHQLCNNGYTPGYPVVKTVDGAPKSFEIFGPKILATIGNVEESLHTRCIVVPTIPGTPAIEGDDTSMGKHIGKRLNEVQSALIAEIKKVYHSKASLERPELIEGRDWQILRPLWAVATVIIPSPGYPNWNAVRPICVR